MQVDWDSLEVESERQGFIPIIHDCPAQNPSLKTSLRLHVFA
jgi:hypothetical protein